MSVHRRAFYFIYLIAPSLLLWGFPQIVIFYLVLAQLQMSGTDEVNTPLHRHNYSDSN
jgi:hypothetical protein